MHRTDTAVPSLQVAEPVADRFAAARRWYEAPDLIPVAREHDAQVEPRYARHVADLVSQVAAPNPSVIDVGCGEGLLAQALTDFTWYIGVDPDPSQLHTATTPQVGVSFERARAEDLPGDLPTADAVVSSLSLGLWSERAAGLRQLAQMVHSGGRLLVLDLLRTSPPRRYRAKTLRQRFLLDQYNASLSWDELISLRDAALPEASLTVLTDDGTSLVPGSPCGGTYGQVFLIDHRAEE